MTAKAKAWRYERVSPLLEMGPALLFYQIQFVTFLFLSPLTAKMLRFVDRLGERFRELDTPLLVEWPDGRRAAGGAAAAPVDAPVWAVAGVGGMALDRCGAGAVGTVGRAGDAADNRLRVRAIIHTLVGIRARTGPPRVE